VLNFQVTMTLTLIAAFFLLLIIPVAFAIMEETGVATIEENPIIMILMICTPMPLILIGIFCTYQGVVNAMRALSDKPIRYALSIPFVK